MPKKQITRHIQKFEKFAVWWVTPPAERTPPTMDEFAEVLEVDKQTLINWSYQFEQGGDELKIELLLDRAFKDAILPSSNPRDKEVYARMVGAFEKKERDVIFEPTADYFQSLIKRAEKELRDWHEGNMEVQKESDLFFDELCLYTEPEHGSENQMASVEVPS